ncbi:Leishmanolysin-like peptidase [Bienertia sinuspersici]
MSPIVWDTVTLRFWHGERLNVANTGEMICVGGQGRKFKVDPDELCYWKILEMAKKCGNYSTIIDVFYLVPSISLLEGLRKVADDSAVIAIGDLVMKYRTLDLYVLHEEHALNLRPANQLETITHFQPLLNEPQPSKPQKLTPRRGSHAIKNTPTRTSPRLKSFIFLGTSSPVLDSSKANYDWIDPRPESPIHYIQLINESSDDSDDPLYDPEDTSLARDDVVSGESLFIKLELEEEFEVEGHELQQLQNEVVLDESENSDEEYHIARERVAKQLQREAAEGKLTTQHSKLKQPTTVEQGDGENGYESEYYDSEDDIHTQPSSDNECEGGRRTKRDQRFATREDFKQAVAKYAIMQGRNVSVVVSNKSRRQEIGW